MNNNYNIMAEHIASRYVDSVSGKDIEETFVDDSPSQRVMVGMLAEDRVNESFSGGYVENNDTRFESVPSLSVSFKVRDNAGSFAIKPKGLLFYTIEPDYEKTISYILNRYSEKDHRKYTSIDELPHHSEWAFS